MGSALNLDSARLRNLSEQWRKAGHAYAKSINRLIKRGSSENPPLDGRSRLTAHVLKALRLANRLGAAATFRKMFPPATHPFGPSLNIEGRAVGPVVILPDGRVLARVHTPLSRAVTFLVDERRSIPVKGVGAVGRSSNHRYVALARREGIEIIPEWGAAPLRRLRWPTGTEGAWSKLSLKPIEVPRGIEQLTPFPDGQRVLLVCRDGIFVVGTRGSMRIHPGFEWQRDYIRSHQVQFPKDPPIRSVDLSMPHAALSPDGTRIAVGDQCSQHRILDDDLKCIASISPATEYPHHAIFSADGRQIALNSCHLYDGETLGVSLSRLGRPRERDRVKLDQGCRVYAAAPTNDGYILGNAYGYLHAVNTKGKELWNYHLGGTISGMDVSPNGRFLAVGTYAGVLHCLELHAGNDLRYTVGTGSHRECWRWIFWKSEKRPLAW